MIRIVGIRKEEELTIIIGNLFRENNLQLYRQQTQHWKRSFDCQNGGSVRPVTFLIGIIKLECLVLAVP